ncbi:MAG: hypothetical protein NC826_06095 [Candidatus Omnitrophica bacterium]|nr:hypothetical protein [Candidatus Omnitrophota bacterium]
MASLWVKAGICRNEVVISTKKKSPTKIELSFETNCKHVKALAEDLKEINIGIEMSCPMNETEIYKLSSKHLCRNSCIVPAAILKAIEVTAGLFLPAPASIEFIEGQI